jgi:hypothetical protein
MSFLCWRWCFPSPKIRVKTIRTNSEFRHPLATKRSYKTRNGRVEEISEARGSGIGNEVATGLEDDKPHRYTGVVHALYTVSTVPPGNPYRHKFFTWRRGAA